MDSVGSMPQFTPPEDISLTNSIYNKVYLSQLFSVTSPHRYHYSVALCECCDLLTDASLESVEKPPSTPNPLHGVERVGLVSGLSTAASLF